jgi:hypothetical protein
MTNWPTILLILALMCLAVASAFMVPVPASVSPAPSTPFMPEPSLLDPRPMGPAQRFEKVR